MLQYGKDSALPETYRITLAVSVALLAHTLLMAGVPFEMPDHNHNPVTVSVELVPQGSAPSSDSAPSQTRPPVQATPFNIEETPKPKGHTVPEPQSQPDQQSASASSAPASEPSAAGGRSAERQDAEQQLALRSETPSEESSYISLLAQTIGEKARIRKLENLESAQVLSVELELNLMSNGALVGASITETSGNDGLDQQVYRAALAASPYPEPPSSTSRQQRFRVEVRYTF